MTAIFWRFAAACLFLIDLSFGGVPYATAADMTLVRCQSLVDETALAESYDWHEVKILTGNDASLFLSKYNAEPPSTDLKADSIHVFKKQGVSQVGFVFIKDGCVVKRDFLGPALVEKLLGQVV